MGCFVPPTPDEPSEVRTIPPVQDLTGILSLIFIIQKLIDVLYIVMCLADGVQVGVRLGGYDGIIYVKGHSQDQNCRRLVTSNEIDNIDFKVLFGNCGLIHVDVCITLIVFQHSITN